MALKKGREAERAYDRAYTKARYAADPEFRRKKAEHLRNWRKKNPEKVRAQWLRHDANNRKARAATAHARTLSRYGMSAEDYAAIYKRQKGKCAICLKPEPRKFSGKPARLSLDHDHESGEPRGLLCTRCNTGLGMFRDKTSLCIAAWRYLAKWRKYGGR